VKRFYEITYRYFRAPWDIGAREELVSLVESGRIQPGRAIDLGCGAGANAIYLAQKRV
jgi:methylase of polypeptide subunit release factors